MILGQDGDVGARAGFQLWFFHLLSARGINYVSSLGFSFLVGKWDNKKTHLKGLLCKFKD